MHVEFIQAQNISVYNTPKDRHMSWLYNHWLRERPLVLFQKQLGSCSSTLFGFGTVIFLFCFYTNYIFFVYFNNWVQEARVLLLQFMNPSKMLEIKKAQMLIVTWNMISSKGQVTWLCLKQNQCLFQQILQLHTLLVFCRTQSSWSGPKRDRLQSILY